MRKNKLLLLLVLLMTAATGAWAEEQVVYTLDGTQTANNTAYTTAGVVNQGGMAWMVTGNTRLNPWRIGGKSLSGVDRSIWSESSLDETVTKVTLEFGTASSITVNSITMTVAGDDGFSDVIDTKAVTFSANNTVDVTPTEGKEWKNAYYRFVFNVTVSGSSNKYFQLKSIKFYNDPDAQQQGGSTEPVAGTFTVSLKEGTKDAKNWSIASGEKSAKGDAADGLTGLKEKDAVTLTYTGRLKVKGVKATSDAAPAVKPAATVTTAPTATTGDIVAGSETALVSGGAATGGTMMYKVTTENTMPASTDGFSEAVPTAQSITASGKVYVWYYVKGDDTHSDSEIAATAIEVPVADIVWDATNISDLEVYGTDEYVKEGVKLSGNADVDATWNNSTNPTKVGINFSLHESGGFTFTAPTGKAFTKIEMMPNGPNGWDTTNLGTGWAFNNLTVTWTGSAASTVKLLTDVYAFNGATVISIVFYLVDAE